MFALALWDASAGRLLLARDRSGKKPLFYSVGSGRLTFGSEIKALLAAPWIDARPDMSRLGEFLTYGYVPHPATFYEGIVQVPPACTLTFDGTDLRGPTPYWSALPQSPRRRRSKALDVEIAERLRTATQRRMISDVPLGALLSGGIDSSLVVGLMTEATSEPIHTFSIGFPDDPSFDERAPARRVAEHFGTRHTEFAVQLDAVALLDRLVWHHDGPFHDSSAIPTYVVSRLAREHVTVVLNGDGGDEVFGGYDRFRAARISRLVPGQLGGIGRRAAARLSADHGYYSLNRRAGRFLENAELGVKDRYQGWIAVLNDALLGQILRPELAAELSPNAPAAAMNRRYEEAHDAPDLDQIIYANFATYLPDDLAVKMDRMSMAHSLEARSPFLDSALMDVVAHVRASDKVGLRQLKPLLRRAFDPLLPEEIWTRRKHGFGVPMGAWFRGELGELFRDEVLAADARSLAFLRRDAVERLWQEQRAGECEHGFRLWTLLTLERWLRTLERPVALTPPADTTSAEVAA